MNKTININLDGLSFQIEEDAYSKLENYLNTIEKRLGSTDEAKEILADIESRIAELFVGKYHKSIITLSAVDEIIATIGEPAAIVDEENPEPENTGDQSQSQQQQTYSGRKGLFRDPDDRILGGVCSGLGAYLNVDPLVFRIIAVVATILSIGAAPLVYIVLWIAMPKAVTLKQRMEMRGGFSFKNFEDNVKREYDDVSERFRTYKSSKNYRNMQTRMNRTGDVMANGLNAVLKVLGAILGVGIVLWSLLMIMAMVGFVAFRDTLLGLIISEGEQYITDLPNMLLSGADQLLLTIAAGLLIGIPLLAFLYLGLKLIFRFPSNGKLLSIIGLTLWLAGVVMSVYVALRIIESYRATGSTNETVQLAPSSSSTIYLKASESNRFDKGFDYLFDIDDLEAVLSDEEIKIQGEPRIELQQGNSFKMELKKTARGSNEEIALINANAIEYNWLQQDSVLYLDRLFTMGKEGLARKQVLSISITCPENSSFDIDPSLQRFITNQ